jgi:hypothetical protein
VDASQLYSAPGNDVNRIMSATLYEPINVYKPLAPEVGIVDGPFEYLTALGVRWPLPFTTRMTVIRLSNGELILHSPIAFDERLAAEIQARGTIRHLVSPNQFHYAHIGEWARAFPRASTWASPGVRRRARSRGVDVDFSRELGEQPPVEWRDEVDQVLVPGGIFKEYAFFHRPSRILVLTDSIMNFELGKLTQPWRAFARLSGMYHPHGQLFFGMRLPLRLQRKKARAAIEKIHSWQAERIVLSHGRCFEADAGRALRRLLGNP